MTSSSNRLIVAILVVAALAIGFWMLLLGPKREEVKELGTQAEGLEFALSEARSQLAQAEAARQAFPADYRQLVVLGQAVPEGDETSSLLVELNQVSSDAKMRFERLELTGSGELSAPVATAPPATAPPTEIAESGAVPVAAAVPPTEAAAAVLPIGATIGSAGLGTMPYTLSFQGSFFRVADFISEIDSLIHTGDARVAVDGRLITLNGFALSPDPNRDFPYLRANFSVTTYVTPPTQGITAGANPTAPAPVSSGSETATTASGGAAAAEATQAGTEK